MKIKKMFPVFLFLVILNSISVYAKNTWVLPQSIENIFVFIFDTLPAGVRSESTLAIVYFKFLLWIFVFAAIYSAMKKVMHDNNRLAATAALVISLSSVMLISNRIILMIFGLYSTVISIVLAILPLLILLYFGKKLFPNKDAKSGWVKGLLFILAAMIILFLSIAIAESGTSDMYSELARWMEIAAVICFFLGIIMFLEGAGSMVKGDYGRSSRDWGGGGNAPRGGNRPNQPNQPNPQPNQPANQNTVERLNHDIDDFIRILGEHQDTFNQLHHQFQITLQINRINVVNAGGVPGTVHPLGWNRITENQLGQHVQRGVQLREQLNRYQAILYRTSGSIIANHEFTNLAQADQDRYRNANTRFGNLQGDILSLVGSSRHFYARGEELTWP